MKINQIHIINDGYVNCKSVFYSAQNILDNARFTFSTGINKLKGEIDSGNWAVSYLLSMYKYRPKDFVLFNEPSVTVNNQYIPMKEFSKFSCYMDKIYPLFSKKASVKKLIMQGLDYSKNNYSINDIKDLFCLSDQRFGRPLAGVGNEIFRAMSAIAFAYNKQIFCFPWLSKMRFDGYHENLTVLLQILEDLKKIVILPVGI